MSELEAPPEGKLFDCKVSDIATAASLLTRLPLREEWVDGTRLSASAWAYPVVGGVIGVLAGLFLTLLGWIGVSSAISAVAALGLMILLTGGLHEDGIADCADGLGGASTMERALEIMKDSRLGAFGATILVLFLIARWSSIDMLANSSPVVALAAVGVASRLPMVVVMATMEPARLDGLSRFVGKPSRNHAVLAGILTLLILLALLGAWGFFVLLIALLSGLPLVNLARKKLGGQTGDILGGIQQCAEVSVLAVLVTMAT